MFAIPFGVISAVRRDSIGDYTSRVASLVGVSVPNFWLATLLLIFTSRVFHWVPPLTYVSPFDDPLKNLSEFILPGDLDLRLHARDRLADGPRARCSRCWAATTSVPPGRRASRGGA